MADKEDVKEKTKKIFALLPKLNDKKCGYRTCGEFARAVAEGKAPCYGCVSGGPEVAAKVCEVMGDKIPEQAFSRTGTDNRPYLSGFNAGKGGRGRRGQGAGRAKGMRSGGGRGFGSGRGRRGRGGSMSPKALAIIPALTFFIVIMSMCSVPARAADPAPLVTLETTHGPVTIELDSVKAPGTVANFIQYVQAGFYNGTIFHRVIPGFMIQGGGFTADMQQKKTNAPIHNEADNGLANQRGTVAMARTGDPHSATAQFFINTVDNSFLNHRSKDTRGWGYCVFGRVVNGLEVVDAISRQPTKTVGMYQNAPIEPIVIKKAALLPKKSESTTK